MQDFDGSLLDQLAIRQLVDAWIIYRDQRRWNKVEALWHEGGVMMTTWGGTATPQEFSRAAEAGFQAGDRMLHSNGGTAAEIVGDRAIAQTKMRIMQRGTVEGVLCDITCLGRDYDFVERRNGRWGFVMRQPIYERDSVVPVNPGETLELDEHRLAAFPDGYSRLAYVQEAAGHRIIPTMPVLTGQQVEALYAKGAEWLEGGEADWRP